MSFIARSCPVCSSTKTIKSPAIVAPFLTHRMFGWKPVTITEDDNFRDIDSGTSYQICNTCECSRCELVYSDIRFHNKDLSYYYKNYQTEDFFAQRESFEHSFSERRKSFLPGTGIISGDFKKIKSVEKFIEINGNFTPKKKTILDYGGSVGKGAPFCNSGATLYNFDLDNRAKSAKNFVKKKDFKSYDFDLITIRNVLEHTPYPRKILSELANVSQKNTLFYIELPYENLMSVYPAGSRSREKKIWHEHINFFSHTTLQALAESAKLEVVKQEDLVIESNNELDDDNNRVHLMCLLRK